MNIEEHMSKELLEKQQRKESLIIRFGDERKGSLYNHASDDEKYNLYRLSDPALILKVYDVNDYMQEPINRKRISYLAQERIKKDHAYLYDTDKYVKSLLLAALWNDAHPLYHSNSRHYFNPYTLKLEPIASDSIGPIPIRNYGIFPRKSFDPFVNNIVYEQLKNADDYNDLFKSNLPFVVNVVNRSAQSSLNDYQKYFPLDAPINIESALASNIYMLQENSAQYLNQKSKSQDALAKKKIDRSHKKTDAHVQVFYRQNGVLDIYNMIPDEVIFDNILLDGKMTSEESINIALPAYTPNIFKPSSLNTTFRGGMRGRLAIRTLYNGKYQVTPVKDVISPITYQIPDKTVSFNYHSKPNSTQSKKFLEHVHARHYENGDIAIFNLLDDKIKLSDLKLDGKSVLTDEVIIPGYSAGEYQPTVITSNLKGTYDSRITLHTQYKDNSRNYTVPYTYFSENYIYNPLVIENIQSHSFIKKTKNDAYVVPAGKWSITSPIVLKGDLYIESGTELKFSSGAYLIVEGSLNAKGTYNKPITFKAKDNDWKGVYIYNSNKQSVLEYVSFHNANALTDGILELTGGVTFYNTSVSMRAVGFYSSIAEDALNLVESRFQIGNIEVYDAISDGIDFDYSEGSITNSHFARIDGDGIDFSGSNVEVSNLSFNAIKDKAISVGEGTTVSVREVSIVDSGVGIASKDGSVVTGSNIKISDFNLAGVMSYVKKSFYGSPSLILDLVDMPKTENAYSRQKNSYMKINGKEISEESVDVKGLYKSEIMAK